ncbi:unnamed protein product [Clavelina lepadiformis]|uniref:Uncharacterized protein n=1 Tax=Clavelina lepadiformis TaxID=159417 RepID=A0ABP0G6E0_CLALP
MATSNESTPRLFFHNRVSAIGQNRSGISTGRVEPSQQTSHRSFDRILPMLASNLGLQRIRRLQIISRLVETFISDDKENCRRACLIYFTYVIIKDNCYVTVLRCCKVAIIAL